MKKHFLLPTNLNKEPYLSVWWMEDCNPTVFFMQVSEDNHNPLWVKCGDILELLCRKELDTDTNFMEMIMSAFRSKEHTPAITHIKEVIVR